MTIMFLLGVLVGVAGAACIFAAHRFMECVVFKDEEDESK